MADDNQAQRKSGGGIVKKLGIGVLVLIVGVVGVGLVLPSGYEVERSVVIDADRATVHEWVANLEKWPAWEPWTADDPTIAVTLGEKTTGVGASQSWDGEKSGPGKLKVTKCSLEEGVGYDLDIHDGTYLSTAEITYADEGDGTKVTWKMQGDNGMNIIGRYFGLMMDGMVGPFFENGLGKLKTAAEGGAPEAPAEAAGEEAPADDG